MSELVFRTQVILLKKRLGFTTMFCPLTLMVFLSPIVLTLSVRCSVISQHFFPVILEAAAITIWTALSQLMDVSAITPVAIDTR